MATTRKTTKKPGKKISAKHQTRPKAEGHERGLWKGAISFGLVNIGVRLVSAKEQPDLHFTMLDPSNLSPVGYKYYNKTTGDEVSRSQTVKAYEHKDGSYVIMTDADFKRANPKATQTIDIENFVQLEEIDPVFFEKAYYLLPAKGGEKGYKLLCEALKKSGKVAIAKIVLHTKQHLAAVIARGDFLLLELLHFAHDVKELNELDTMKNELPVSKTIGKEIEMAEKLIEDMTSRWNPEAYEDTYREDIMKMVKAKVKAGKATEISEDFEEKEDAQASKVLDLMPLLRQSLEGKGRRSTAKSKANREMVQ